DLKRLGTRTYQDVMADILDLRGQPHRYVLELDPAERERGREHLSRLGVQFDRPLIGLNTGAGGRWELKQWRESGYIELVARLTRLHHVQFILLGGPGERDRN